MLETLYEFSRSGFLELLNTVPEFVLGALLPALLLSGALNVFTTRNHIKHIFGGGIYQPIAYLLATFIGIIFSGCACGVLPLFTALLEAGSTFGPAITFLFAGPTINITAVVLTGQIFTWSLGFYRILFTIFWALLIGVFMQFLFKKNYDPSTDYECEDCGCDAETCETKTSDKIEVITTSSGNLIFIMISLLILLLLESYTEFEIFTKIYIWIGWLVIFIPILLTRFNKQDISKWLVKTGHFTKKIMIPLAIGIFIVGGLKSFQQSHLKLLQNYFGNESWSANFISSIIASLMYFGTCVSVMIVKFFQNSGMANGPMISIFLAGPVVSLPSMIAMYRIIKFKRTAVYVVLVIIAGTVSGYTYGNYLVEHKHVEISHLDTFVFSTGVKNKIILEYFPKQSKKVTKKFQAEPSNEIIKEYVSYIRNKIKKDGKYKIIIKHPVPNENELNKILKNKGLEISKRN